MNILEEKKKDKIINKDEIPVCLSCINLQDFNGPIEENI
jgi:hypothetical protein